MSFNVLSLQSVNLRSSVQSMLEEYHLRATSSICLYGKWGRNSFQRKPERAPSHRLVYRICDWWAMLQSFLMTFLGKWRYQQENECDVAHPEAQPYPCIFPSEFGCKLEQQDRDEGDWWYRCHCHCSCSPCLWCARCELRSRTTNQRVKWQEFWRGKANFYRPGNLQKELSQQRHRWVRLPLQGNVGVLVVWKRRTLLLMHDGRSGRDGIRNGQRCTGMIHWKWRNWFDFILRMGQRSVS